MAELAIYFARAMDARSNDDIISDDEEYARLLEFGGARIINPFKRNSLNLVQNSLGVAEDDLALLRMGDIVLADLSLPNYQYVGCILEVAYAVIHEIPVILVVGETDLSRRVFFQAYCDFITKEPREAVEFIRRVYTQEGTWQQMVEMKAYYSEIASNYSARSARTHKRTPKDMEPFLRERSELRMVIRTHVEGRACQIGIGTGDWTQTVCETADEVIGVEQSSQMLAQARVNLSSFSDVAFLQCDALEEDIAGGPFDCVVIYFLLSLLPPSMQDNLLDRVRRILKPSGVLIVADTKKLGDLPAIGLGRRQLQKRKSGDKEFILYKEHFVGDSLLKLLENKGYETVDSGRGTVWFSWAVARRSA